MGLSVTSCFGFGSTEKLPSEEKCLVIAFFGVLLLSLPLVIIIVDPVVLFLKYQLRIENGSLIHEAFKKEKETVHVSTYLFNITNPDQFMEGQDDKLKIQEIGPFTYRELRFNRDLKIDLEAGVMRYAPLVRTEYIPNASIANPEDLNVTMPNFVMMSLASIISSYNIIAKIGFNVLVKRLNSKPLVSVSAEKYLWGFDEPLVTAGRTLVPGLIHFDKIGIMERLYDQSKKFTLEVGMTNEDKFEIKTMDGIGGLEYWDYDVPSKRTRCNTFVDSYEGLLYRTDVTPEMPMRIFRNTFCRFLELDFVERRTLEVGADALVYKISDRTYTMNPDKECLCKKASCVINGISDISPCAFGLPLAISNAHFLGGDSRLFEKIEGLNPDEKKHGSQFLIEPKLGLSLGTSFTIQINLVMAELSSSSSVARFSDMVIPLGYFKINHPEMAESTINLLKLLYVTGPNILLCIYLVMGIGGFALLVYATLTIFKNERYSGNIIHNEQGNNKFTKKLNVEVPLIKREGPS